MSEAGQSLVCAIDAQISPDIAGGTETALLSLISAVGGLDSDERFVLLGLKDYAHKLRPFMGPNQTMAVWPWTYSWYDPKPPAQRPLNAPWQRLRSMAGPAGPLVERLHRRHAHGKPLGRIAERIRVGLGPAGGLVPPLYRLYYGLRFGNGRSPSRAQADAQLRSHAARVVHFPYPLHFPTKLPFIYEPWGLPHLHTPELFQPGEPSWMDGVFRDGCEKASLVVTATRWIKNDIVSKYGIPPGRIAVIPRLPQPPPPAERPRDEPAHEFAFFPAMTWPTKNHVRLLRALARLRDEHGIRQSVVCTGRIYANYWPVIQAELERLKLGEQVRFLGSVSGEEMRRLFLTARFLIFPSLFEGLGLPVIEAFQHSLPVVASTATCLPEVIGDAGILFDPKDEDAIAGALLLAVRNPGLLEELRARGRARLARFSHAKMARMFVTCYRSAAGASLSEEQRALLEEMTAA